MIWIFRYSGLSARIFSKVLMRDRFYPDFDRIWSSGSKPIENQCEKHHLMLDHPAMGRQSANPPKVNDWHLLKRFEPNRNSTEEFRWFSSADSVDQGQVYSRLFPRHVFNRLNSYKGNKKIFFLDFVIIFWLSILLWLILSTFEIVFSLYLKSGPDPGPIIRTKLVRSRNSDHQTGPLKFGPEIRTTGPSKN